MSARVDVFIDTSALLYATATEDWRAPKAITALGSGGITSVHVLSEFTFIARGRLRRSWPDIHEALSIFKQLCPKPLPVRLSTYEMALELVQQDGLGLQDAIIAASALSAGCSRLLSGMRPDGRVIGEQLTVCNPFGFTAMHISLGRRARRRPSSPPANQILAPRKPRAGQ